MPTGAHEVHPLHHRLDNGDVFYQLLHAIVSLRFKRSHNSKAGPPGHVGGKILAEVSLALDVIYRVV